MTSGEARNRGELTEKILAIKREKGLKWMEITDHIGGMSPVLVVGALLGQMKLLKPLARKAAELLGITEQTLERKIKKWGLSQEPVAHDS